MTRPDAPSAPAFQLKISGQKGRVTQKGLTKVEKSQSRYPMTVVLMSDQPRNNPSFTIKKTVQAKKRGRPRMDAVRKEIQALKKKPGMSWQKIANCVNAKYGLTMNKESCRKLASRN
jgi:hypothetical protein